MAVPPNLEPLDEFWRVLHLSGSYLEAVRTLRKEEWDAYSAAAATVRQVETNADLYTFVQKNYEEFATTLADLEALRVDAPDADRLGPTLALTVNRKLSSFLSAMRSFLDHSEMRIKRRYGNTSLEADAFRSACSTLFDQSFAYRFAYKLRNYSQHFSRPVGHMHASSWLDSVTEARSDANEICFDVTELITGASGIWGELVLGDLRSGPQLLQVRPIMTQVADDLHEVWNTVLRIDAPELLSAAAIINELVGPYPPPPFKPVIGRWENCEGRLALRYEHPPQVILKEGALNDTEGPARRGLPQTGSLSGLLIMWIIRSLSSVSTIELKTLL